MLMFVRFQKTADGVFFAPIDPKYNVLSLVTDFFVNAQLYTYDNKPTIPQQ